MRRAEWVVVLVVVVGVAGCATVSIPSDLADAKKALVRARESPVSTYAYVELREAELAFRAAEDAALANPGSREASEASFMASRMADRARFAGVYAADREALEGVRQKTSRLRDSVERLRLAKAEHAQRMVADAALRSRKREEQLRALQSASFGTATRDGSKIVLSIPAGELFIPGYPLLREMSPPRIEAIAGVLLAGPPSQIVIDVAEHLGGPGNDPNTLARRRADRLREALVGRGVSLEIMDTDGHAAPIERVNIVITERDEVAPPPIPDGVVVPPAAAPSGPQSSVPAAPPHP